MAADRRKLPGITAAVASDRARPSPDWELAAIERARHDPAAFAPLYEAYADLIWRYAIRRLGHAERAADATSQTFVKAIAALPRFQPDRRGGQASFRSWLMTIAHNVVIDEVRKARPTTDMTEPSIQAWLIDPDHTPEEAALALAERQRIQNAVAQLPDTQRQIVELRGIGMKGAEIAQVLDMSLAAVKTANFRAFHRLRELLADDTPGQDANP